MPTAYHMVHYRRFDANSAGSQNVTLEGLCRQALDQADNSGVSLWGRAQDRLFDLADSSGRQVILNRIADLSSAVFGEMCLFQSQDFQALLELQASKVQLSNITTAEIFNLAERSAPSGSKFIRGLGYWITIGNHLFFVKTQSMTAQFIHTYIEWLLKTRTSTIPQGAIFKLQAEFDKTQVTGDIGDITSLRVSGKSAPQMTIMPPSDDGEKKIVKTSRTLIDKSYISEKAVSIAEAVFGKTRTDALIESLGPDEYLSADASVKVRGRRTAQSREKLRELANDLAELTDEKVQVEGKDGKLSDDDAILRTRMPFNQPHAGSSILEFDHVADQLQEVYSRFVHDGKIEA